MNLLFLPLVTLEEIMLYLDHAALHSFAATSKYALVDILKRNQKCVGGCGKTSVCLRQCYVLDEKRDWCKIIRVTNYSPLQFQTRFTRYIGFKINPSKDECVNGISCKWCINLCSNCSSMFCAHRPAVALWGARACGRCVELYSVQVL